MAASIFEHPDMMYVVILGLISLVVMLVGVLGTFAAFLYRLQARTMQTIGASFERVTDKITDKLNAQAVDLTNISREVSRIQGALYNSHHGRRGSDPKE